MPTPTYRVFLIFQVGPKWRLALEGNNITGPQSNQRNDTGQLAYIVKRAQGWTVNHGLLSDFQTPHSSTTPDRLPLY
jgi:hypothetical protein